MRGFVARRLAQMVAVLFAVSVLTFLIFNVIPNGDPAVRMAGKSPTERQVEAIRSEWGFDDSLPAQYVRMMENVLGGDAISYFTRVNVRDEIAAGIPRTWVSNPNSLSCALTSFAEARKSGKSVGAVISNPKRLPS